MMAERSWDYEQVEQLIERLLPSLPLTSRQELAKCVAESRSPGLVKLAADRLNASLHTSFSSRSKLASTLRTNGNLYIKARDEFLRVSEINVYLEPEEEIGEGNDDDFTEDGDATDSDRLSPQNCAEEGTEGHSGQSL